MNILRLTILLAALVQLGCGGVSDMPEVGTVSGKLTLDGKPVENATIMFHPIEDGRSSTATSDADGNYELEYMPGTPGAKIGQHEVVVTTFVEESGTDEGDEKVPGREEIIPEKYQPQSELKVEVKAGDNTINLDLTS